MSLKEEFAAVSEKVGALAEEVVNIVVVAYDGGCGKLVDAAGCDAPHDDVHPEPVNPLDLEHPQVSCMEQDPLGGQLADASTNAPSTMTASGGSAGTDAPKDPDSGVSEAVRAGVDVLASMFHDAINHPLDFVSGVDNDKVSSIVTSALASAKGDTEADRIQAAYNQIQQQRAANSTDTNLAAAEHYFFARGQANEGVVHGVEVAVAAPIYDPLKAITWPLRDSQGRLSWFDVDDKPASPPTLGAVFWGEKGVWDGFLQPDKAPAPATGPGGLPSPPAGGSGTPSR